ncbi:MAG: YdeI/OmpD-associated family protein [Ignavibacteriaceae bacterium]|nr:YdeI/OmpD-associated family protein [Ignavibacteriaceae bacterium]
MAAKDKRVDEYIQKASPFARPVLNQIRKIVHKTCPDAAENIKWSFPVFDYNGGILCHMAAFKAHCAFGFRLGGSMNDQYKIFKKEESGGMGLLGQIRTLDELPSEKILTWYIHEAMRLHDEGVKIVRKKTAAQKKVLETPEWFEKELRKNKTAWKVFEAASYSFRKEYIMWLIEAKTDATRFKRLETAVEWIAEGKGRNWKYEKK